jgi:S-adenosylmethionine hydrolase
MTILHVDRFGNLVTNLGEMDFAAAVMQFAPDRSARRVTTFADGADGEVVLLVGSCGLLELVVNGGSAAQATALGRGDVVEVMASVRGADVV